MKKLLIPILIVTGSIFFFKENRPEILHKSSIPEKSDATSDALFAEAFEKHQSDLVLEGQGTVVKLLPDDIKGARHQRFIVKLNSGQTLQLAHNIDLAPRIDSLNKGDFISFRGEYEWNPKGGVVHWTHHDPTGQHSNGWIKFEKKVFQ